MEKEFASVRQKHSARAAVWAEAIRRTMAIFHVTEEIGHLRRTYV